MTEQPRRMRILCLHGMGTSAEIFKSQTAAFRSLLPPTFTFEFLDAAFDSAPAPGTEAIFDSGRYAWWTQPTPPQIRAAHRQVLGYMGQHGPFDILMGFSQGCSLISSLLLYHARESASLQNPPPLPFRAAVFICGGVPLTVLEDLGVQVPRRAWEINERTFEMMKQKASALSQMASNPDQIRRGVGLWDDTAGLLHDPARAPDDRDVFGLDFTALPPDLRISIPTVHVYGAKDPRYPASLQLAHLCENCRQYDHGGGHDIPRSTEVSTKIVKLLLELSKEIEDK